MGRPFLAIHGQMKEFTEKINWLVTCAEEHVSNECLSSSNDCIMRRCGSIFVYVRNVTNNCIELKNKVLRFLIQITQFGRYKCQFDDKHEKKIIIQILLCFAQN